MGSARQKLPKIPPFFHFVRFVVAESSSTTRSLAGP
jgi:hypothetical protein